MSPLEYPAVALAALAVLGMLARAILGGFRFARNLDETVRYIRHEMELNSGRTMRDAISRIEHRVSRIERRVTPSRVEVEPPPPEVEPPTEPPEVDR